MPKFLMDSILGSALRRVLAFVGVFLTEKGLIDAEGWEKFVVWFIPVALSFAWSTVIRLLRKEEQAATSVNR
jgi:hypothetical protein